MNNLGEFSSDILLLILQQLNSGDLYECAFINQRFYTAVLPLIWNEPILQDIPTLTRLLTGPPQSPYHFAQHIRRLDFYGRQWTDETFLFVMKHVNNLEHLTLCDLDYIVHDSFQQFPQHIPHLKSLTLDNINVDAWALVELGRYCHELGRLTVGDCPGLDLRPAVFYVLADCPLEQLDITFWYDNVIMTREEWAMVGDDVILDLTRFDRLTRLSLDGAPTIFIDRILTTTTDANGNTAWPRLRELTLGGFDRLHSQGKLDAFLRLHPLVRSWRYSYENPRLQE